MTLLAVGAEAVLAAAAAAFVCGSPSGLCMRLSADAPEIDTEFLGKVGVSRERCGPSARGPKEAVQVDNNIAHFN